MTARKSSLLVAVLLFGAAFSLQAADTARVLGANAVAAVIRQFHPVVNAAQLAVYRAEAGITEARGAFDPYVNATTDRKQLAGKLYYSYTGAQLVVPTWYGLDLKAGVEEVAGDRVNPEASLGQYSFAGVKFTPTSVLFDKRRAVLQQAKAVAELTDAERRLAVNDVVFEGVAAYWNWLKEYRQYRILTDALKLNQDRMRFVKLEYEQGSRPAIDTTEALGQYLSVWQQQSAAYVAWRNAAIDLSAYLWTENGTTWVPDEYTIPDTLITEHQEAKSLPDWTRLGAENHPKLAVLNQKNDVLLLERKLKAQYLLPKLSFSASYINKGFKTPEEINTDVLANNYKFAADLSMPLFLREGRGAYSATKYKLKELELQRELATVQITNKITAYYNEWEGLGRQLNLMRQVYGTNEALYRGEVLKYQNGESTLFLVNARENKLLETGQKLTDIQAKYQKAYAGLFWAAGAFN